VFTIDLLKGNGVPLRSNPRRAALAAVPILVPAFLFAGLLGHMFYNRLALETDRHILQRMQTRITKARKQVLEYEHTQRTIQQTRNHLREVARALNRHAQWSGVLTALARELPEPIAVRHLELKRSATRKKVASKDDPEQVIRKVLIHRVLEITLYGPVSGQTDQAVAQYLDRLEASPDVAPMIESIRIASRYEEDIDDRPAAVYKIECLCKSQES